MRVLLPPSESKRPDGGNAVYTPESLLFHTELGPVRQRIASALATVSVDLDSAPKLLKVGVKAASEIEHNTRLFTAPTLPAIERYTGVLYDAIQTPDVQQQEWLREHVWIQSALFGLIRSFDKIPPYRLSASSQLTGQLGATLKRTWNEAGSHICWPKNTFLLDLRSQDYAALIPIPDALDWCHLEVVTRSSDGTTRALNHFNKKAKGQLITLLSQTNAEIHSRSDFLHWAAEHGVEVHENQQPHSLRLVTNNNHNLIEPFQLHSAEACHVG